MGRPRKDEIELTEAERDSLRDLLRSRTAPHGLVRRARIVLASAEGASNTEIARYNACSRPFAWTATADDILAKLGRLCNVISGTLH
jgi:hypothetical protein